jgi:hypothetical protein
MADSYKDKVVDELIALRDSGTLNTEQKKYVRSLVNYLVDLDDASVKKTLYATFKEPSLQGGIFRSTLSVLPEDSVINETLISEKPKYVPPKADSIAEAFKDEGGKEVIDERSPNYWAMNPNITRAKIRAVAKSQGMTEQELIKALEQETLKETRRQISLGEDVGSGWFDSPKAFTSRATARVLGLLAPRTMELVREGKDIDPQKMVADIGEDTLYLLNPTGRLLGAGVKALGTRAFGRALLENKLKKNALGVGKNAINAFATPAIVEGAESYADVKSFDPYNVLYGGMANLLGNRILKNRLGRMTANKGDVGKIKNAVTEKAEEKVPPTFKEFKDDLEKNLKAREKVVGKAQGKEAELVLSPSQIQTMQKVKPVFTGDDILDEASTEIAKIVGKSDTSLEEATKKYFEKLKKKDPNKFNAIVDKNNSRKDKLFEFNFEDNVVVPQYSLKKAIGDSSWGEVLKTKFTKTPRKKRDSFIKRFLMNELEGVYDPDYQHFLQNKLGKTENIRDASKASLSLFPSVRRHEEELKREKEEEEEKKYRKGYIFNPYVEE